MDNEFENGERRLTAEERAERVRKLKKKRKRRLAFVIFMFCLVVVLIVCPIILFASMRVRRFDFEGTSPYTTDEITVASGVSNGKSLIFIDVDEVKKNIEKSLPYIADVSVSKRFPATLVIKYGEAKKSFAVRTSETSYAIISPDFKVLETLSDVPENTAEIVGAPPAIAVKGETISFNGTPAQLDDNGEPLSDSTLSLLMSISKAIESSGLEDINVVDITTVSHIFLIYNERIVLNLGDGTNIEKKLSLGKKVIDSENETSVFQSGTINLTVDMQAYFSAEAANDIPELAAYLGIEEEPEEQTEEETTDESGENESSDEEETTVEAEEADEKMTEETDEEEA